ncbi:hypothetical protein GCM10027093_40670 [Paraburkholderia jirisanensis]
MKSLLGAVVIAASLAIPAVSFAQADAPEAAPVAATRVAPQGSGASTNAVGGVADGSTGAGAPAHHRFGFLHRGAGSTQPKDACVGPVSFCNIYFGS